MGARTGAMIPWRADVGADRLELDRFVRVRSEGSMTLRVSHDELVSGSGFSSGNWGLGTPGMVVRQCL